MAYQHSTQTRPKFQYIFTALERDNMAAGPVRVSIESEALYEAKAKLKAKYAAIFFRDRQPIAPSVTKFTWRFLALNRTDLKSAPCRLSVDAYTEREARQVLAPYFILSLAARLPVQGIEEITVPSSRCDIATPSTIEKTSTVREVRYA